VWACFDFGKAGSARAEPGAEGTRQLTAPLVADGWQAREWGTGSMPARETGMEGREAGRYRGTTG